MEQKQILGKSKRQPFKWTKLHLSRLNDVLIILEELEEFKPLTLRQVFYQLVGKGLIENSKSSYITLGQLIKFARINEYISWSDIEDRTRAYYDLAGWNDVDAFIKASLEQFLIGYDRDLMQTQKVYIEIWIEKNALSSIFTKVAKQYTIRVVVTAFGSTSFLNDYKERLEYHKHQRPIVLYFGDFDPSGLNMLPTMQETLEMEMKVTGVQYKHIALEKEDIILYKLPHKAEAIKKKDTRTKEHVAKHGMLAVELDALTPNILEQKIRKAIDTEIDIDAYSAEIDKQEKEYNIIGRLKLDVANFLRKPK
jgi:hypothetical protein